MVDTFWTFLVSRVLIQGIGAVVVAIAGVPAHAGSGFFGTFFNWDSGFYGCILQRGYIGPACEAGYDGRAAFFPGYPVLSRGVAFLLGRGNVSSGADAALWFVAVVASFAAAALLYAIVRRTRSVSVARGAVLLLLLGPYGCFLVASYAEGMFLALGLAAWLFALRRNYLVAGLFCAAASFSRVNGLFLAVALVVMYLVTCRREGTRPRPAQLLALLISFAGAAAYFGYLWALSGSATRWLAVQHDLWKRNFQLPWMTLYRQGGKILHSPGQDWRAQYIIELGYAVLLLLILAVLVRRRWWGMATYTVLTMISLMTSSDYQSLARNSLLIFPVYIVLAGYRADPRRRWIFQVALWLGLALLVFNSIQFAVGHWAD